MSCATGKTGGKCKKMTNKEASKDINFIIKCLNKRRMAPCGFCTSDKCIPNPHECAKDDFVIDKAIEALEKQIPKKPIEITRNEHSTKIIGYGCPTCHKDVTGSDFYCWSCGQALDWGDEK